MLRNDFHEIDSLEEKILDLLGVNHGLSGIIFASCRCGGTSIIGAK